MGPYAAVLVMACVIGVQGLLFQDGGLLAMGANIFNMGIVGVVVTHFLYRSIRSMGGGKPWTIFVGGFLSAWISVVIASLITAMELRDLGNNRRKYCHPGDGWHPHLYRFW